MAESKRREQKGRWGQIERGGSRRGRGRGRGQRERGDPAAEGDMVAGAVGGGVGGARQRERRQQMGSWGGGGRQR